MKLKSTCFISLLVLLTSFLAFGQQVGAPSSESFNAGVYFAPNYAFGASSSAAGPLRLALGNGATGSQTVTLQTGYFVNQDGRKVYPFNSSYALQAPLVIDPGTTVQETVTPSAVSCSTPEYLNTCNITATFTQLHGTGSVVVSGDAGIQEAINDAAINGGGMVWWYIDPGIVTLNTGGANTTLGSINIPTRSTVMGAVARVTTTIATCAGGWSLGFSTGTEFGAANTTLTAGTTTDSSTLVPAVAFNAAATAPIAHCTTSNASAGAIHARVWGYKQVAPVN